MLMTLPWALTIPAVLLAILSLRGGRARARFFREALQQTSTFTPPATLIVPVKGYDEGLRDNLASLASQDYPDFELIVCARFAEDIPRNVLPTRCKVVLTDAAESEASEKVQNLLAAVRAARRTSEVFAFADSDGRVHNRWLAALIAPLADEKMGASTGYRWYVPERGGLSSHLRSVWNAAVASTLGPVYSPFAWGGAMAILKETFFAAGVHRAWESAVSDDYALSHCVRDTGLRLAYAPGATVAATDHIGLLELLGWIRRQMIITRVYSRGLWLQGLIAHLIYCAGMVACAAAGWWWLLALQLAPGIWKGAERARLAQSALPEHRVRLAAHVLLVPIATWLWLYSLLASATTSTINWRGRRYNLLHARIQKGTPQRDGCRGARAG